MDSAVFFADEAPSQTIASQLERGEIRRLARGIYTTDLESTPEEVVRREWMGIAGRDFPGAVISDRSAPSARPVGRVLYLVSRTRRELELPGLIISARKGAPAQDSDIELPGGLHQASRARGLVENTLPSRARGGRVRRTLDDDELADWVDHLCAVDGEGALADYRSEVMTLAPTLGVDGKHVDRLSKVIGAALGSQKVSTGSRALNARQFGSPFDPTRVERFEALAAHLRSSAPQTRPAVPEDGFKNQAFFEAYFSNFIEGTEFVLEEAAQIVFEGRLVESRPQDSHDVLGTFSIVGDRGEMKRVAADADEFLELLRRRHSRIMEGRPELAPGHLKHSVNRAGNTVFVHPSLVEGTIREGFERIGALDTAWERAVYVAFIITEVHPFEDGNGRVARAMMNAELVAGDEAKIIVPIGYRTEYLDALRRLTRSDDPALLVKSMRFLQDYTAQIDWTDFDTARRQLAETNAFEDDENGRRLRLRRPLTPAEILDPGLAR